MNKQQYQQREPNFWVRGKIEQKKFYDIRLNASTNFKTFVFGLLLSLIVILPFGFMIFQYLLLYGYDLSVFGVYLALIWIGLMAFNAFSNYFTVKLSQAYAKDIVNLQEIDSKYIFFYQLLNIGFGLFSLLLLIIFGSMILGKI